MQLRRHLAHLAQIDAQIVELTHRCIVIFAVVQDTRTQVASPQDQARRGWLTMQLSPVAFTPQLQRLLHQLSASSDPTVAHALVEFTRTLDPTIFDLDDPVDAPMSDHS